MLSRTKATPKPADDRPRPEPPPVSPPTLPPDFPDIPQHFHSELHPPCPPGATPDKVAGTTPQLPRPETPEAMRKRVATKERAPPTENQFLNITPSSGTLRMKLP